MASGKDNGGNRGSEEVPTGSLGTNKAWEGELPPMSVPERIGNYRILDPSRPLGEGGMGAVYRAEQLTPDGQVLREVALKVIRPGVASAAMLRRFEHEAAILAKLQHPGVATIYEAGTFDAGAGAQPFFAMELIDGRPLTQYAAENNLSTRQRLELIAKVCLAVQHAHQKGIIHRDLKPGNILVTGDGQPKVLDFGVARATDADIQTTTQRTDIGQLIGTIPYMSPEQAGGNPDELDTRSDVYALGVVAYELLAGRLPYDLREKMIHEAVRVIQEDEPTRLSSINRTLRGDVEIIIGKALDKERDRRYQAATDLASDIDRYLNDEPIFARPPSAAYQFRRFARRNKSLVGGVAAVFIVLLVGLVVASTLYVQAEEARAGAVTARDAEAEQRRIAEQREAEAIAAREEAEIAKEAEAQRAEELEKVAAFQESQLADIDTEWMGINLRLGLIEKRRVFLEGSGMDEEQIAEALAKIESSLTGINFTNVALEALDENIFERALIAIDKQFSDEPEIRARLLQTVATTLRELGLLDRATNPQTEAIEVRRRALGDEHPETLTSINNMGGLLLQRGQHTEAQVYVREALEARRRVLGDQHPETLISIDQMGALLLAQDNLTEAELHFRKALDIRRRVLGNDHPETLDSLSNMGALLQTQGSFAEAGVYWKEALDATRRVHGDDHPRTLLSMSNMGTLYMQQGRFAEAEPYSRKALEARRRVLGDAHPETLASINNMGELCWRQGRYAEAELYYTEAIETCRRVLGNLHLGTLIAVNNMGLLLRDQGRASEAEPYLREVMKTCRRVFGDDHRETLTAINNMGLVLAALGKHTEAESYYREALTGRRRVIGDEHVHTLGSITNMGVLLRIQGRYADAESYFREALTGFRSVLGDDHPHTLALIGQLGFLLNAQGELARAEPYFREALAGRRRVLGDQHPETLASINNIGGLLRQLGKLAEAEPYWREVLAGHRVVLGEEHPDTLSSLHNLATLLIDMGAFDEAEELAVEYEGRTHHRYGGELAYTWRAVELLADLYDAWHEAEPNAGYDAKAAEWRDRLPATVEAVAADGQAGSESDEKAEAAGDPGTNDGD